MKAEAKRVLRFILLLAIVALALAPARAAETRQWVTLSGCQYVANTSNDGDSFRVRSGTNEFTLRLYYVDAPEANLVYPERTREQSEHFGVTLDETMKAGARARARVRELLEKPFIVRTRWASAAGRSRETRYYAIVEVGGRSLAEILVSEGLARTKGVAPNLPNGEKARAYMKRLDAMEAQARQKRVGIWAGTTEKKMGTATQ